MKRLINFHSKSNLHVKFSSPQNFVQDLLSVYPASERLFVKLGCFLS